MAEGVREWLSAWEGWRIEAEEFHELDNERVLALVHYSGRGKASELDIARTRSRAANLFHVRGGKVTRYVVWFDGERALADLEREPEVDAP
jgi:hypothetical protein